MVLAVEAAKYNVLLIPFCTGTLDMSYLGLFPATQFDHRNIYLRAEAAKSAIPAVTKTLYKNHHNLFTLDRFQQLLEATGGVWRALESLVNVLRTQFKNKPYTKIDMNELWVALCKEIDQRWKVTNFGDSKYFETIAQYCLTGQPIKGTDTIRGIPVLELMMNGITKYKLLLFNTCYCCL